VKNLTMMTTHLSTRHRTSQRRLTKFVDNENEFVDDDNEFVDCDDESLDCDTKSQPCRRRI